MEPTRLPIALSLALVLAFSVSPLLVGEADAWGLVSCFPDWPACCPDGKVLSFTQQYGNTLCVPLPDRCLPECSLLP